MSQNIINELTDRVSALQADVSRLGSVASDMRARALAAERMLASEEAGHIACAERSIAKDAEITRLNHLVVDERNKANRYERWVKAAGKAVRESTPVVHSSRHPHGDTVVTFHDYGWFAIQALATDDD